MSEAKTFASLSSGLLARKGAARPAMRPQGMSAFSSNIEDLGWNDMGQSDAAEPVADTAFTERHDSHVPSPISALTPMGAGYVEEEEFEPAPPVVEQQRAAIEASFGQPEVDRIVTATKAKKVAPKVDAPAEDGPAIESPKPIVSVAPARLPKELPSSKGKAAFTLRLEAERHLKLRLACAVTGRSAQQLVTEALDQLLKSRPEIDALAGQLPGKAH